MYRHCQLVMEMFPFILKRNTPQFLAVLVQLVQQGIVFFCLRKKRNTFDRIKAKAGKAFVSVAVGT